MPQTLTEIKTLLGDRGLRPKYRFGQNFLHDHNQLARIVDAAAIQPGELVVEVGAGTGTLSEQLLAAGATLIAVEIDADLAPILQERLVERYPDQAQLLIGDVLAAKRELNPALIERIARRPFKLVANLPYNVASPLLIDLVADHPAMRLAVVMLQREVADRIAAPPGGKAYGPLSVIVQAMCEVQRIGILSPGCFWPRPKVESAVLRLTRRDQPLTDDPHGLLAMLHRLFSKRRKQLGAILGPGAWLPEGVQPTDRPERLSVPQIVALAGRHG